MPTLEEMGMRTAHWTREPSDCDSIDEVPAWELVEPREVGLDGDTLEAAAARVTSGELSNVHSFLVVREGKLAFERYFEGPDARLGEPLGAIEFNAETLHDARSVTKSVVGALVGIAHAEGAIGNLDASIASFFPEYLLGREEALAGRTLRHALTMTAGLSWDESSHPYWDPRNDENGLWRAADPLEYALSRTPIAPGGAAFAYNGGLPTILAAIVERTTGVPLDEFARDRLWCPLGVTTVEWIQHHSGVFVAASGLRLTARDLSRFGLMMLDRGRFAGRQIVPEDYVVASLSAQVSTEGRGPVSDYGYQWWIARTPALVPVAVGNGGQRVFVDQTRGLVIAVTAGNYDLPDQGDSPQQLIGAVLAAAT